MRTIGRPFGAKTDASHDRVEVEVEFRLFALDEVLSKISASVPSKTARNADLTPLVAVKVQYNADRQTEKPPNHFCLLPSPFCLFSDELTA